MAKAKTNAKTASKKSTKVIAKKTITKATGSTRGRMPAWVAKAPRFAKDYVLEMRAKGKSYDQAGYKTWRSAAIAKAKTVKAKAAEKAAKAKLATKSKTPMAKTKAKVTAKKK